MIPVVAVVVGLLQTLPVASRQLLAGVDEVGRGALLGPVVASAVILSSAASNQLADLGVTDSKLLSAQKRAALVPFIRDLAIDCRIGYASVREIDRLNILQASLLAMRRAILRLMPSPSFCWVDGNQRIPDLDIPQETLIKGDQKSIEIAAASILAKVWRDTLLIRLDARYPGYDLAANKGYGSPKHRAAIQSLGLTPQHRRSFNCGKQAIPLVAAAPQPLTPAAQLPLF